jgi:formylmethanofuran dehydrogenase subunit C
VTPVVLTLMERPDQRLDLSPLVPHRLATLTAVDIANTEVQTTRNRVRLGDVFRIQMGDPQFIRIEGECDRLDLVGANMSAGEIVVNGSVGNQAGRLMSGGRLIIKGNVGPWAASGMVGGHIEILGSTGDRLGGPLAGEMAGMRGGIVIVRGNVGERAGDRMRRGTILVEGDAGRAAGARMIAGTLMVRGQCGALPGYLMRRGTIVLGSGTEALSPTFIDCGRHELVAARLLAAFVRTYGERFALMLGGTMRRFAGDMAVLGKGEILATG